MSKIAETFCFAAGSLSAVDLAELIVSDRLGFEPRVIAASEIDRPGRRFDSAVHGKVIASSPSLRWLEVRGPAGELFSYANLEDWEFQLLEWTLPWESRHATAFFEELASRPGFTVAYGCDADDLFWQTEDNPGNWDALGRDKTGLALIRDPETGRKVIDVSANPGRLELVQGTRLQSCWRMWFGPCAQRHFSRDRVLAFTEARTVRLLDSGAVFVELYEDGQHPETPDHRRVQRRFREWLAMDAVAERSNQPAAPPDPILEFEEGIFPHGGVRRTTAWLDDAGQPVARSRASRRRVSELSEGGETVWADETEV